VIDWASAGRATANKIVTTMVVHSRIVDSLLNAFRVGKATMREQLRRSPDRRSEKR
jgi:hypothetical protein